MTDNIDAPDLDNAEVDVTPDEVEQQSWQQENGLEGNTTFEKFGSVGDLAKSYSELEKFARSSMRIPTEDASDEVRQQFMDKLLQVEGVMPTPEGYQPPPESAEGYDVAPVEGFTADESLGQLKVEAHKLGLTNAQVNGIHQFLANGVIAQNETDKKQVAQGIAELRGMWGPAFDQKVQEVENTIATLSQKIPALKDTQRTPEFVKLMDLVGGMLGEAGIVRQDPRTTLTPGEARDRINDIENNPKHPAHPDNEGMHGYADARAKLMELYRIAAG